MKIHYLIIMALVLLSAASASASPQFASHEVDHLLYQFSFTDPAWKSNITSIRWTFGDGASSTEFEPIHQYAEHGNYTVRCTAMTQYGNVSGKLALDARAPVIDPDDSTVNIGIFSVPAGLLCASSFVMLVLVRTDNHPAADMIGRRGKGLMTLLYFIGVVFGGLLVFNSLYPGGV